MEGQGTQMIQPTGRKSSYGAVMWGFLPVCLVYIGGLTAYACSFGELLPGVLLPLLFGIGSLGCMAAGNVLGRKKRWLKGLSVLPWLLAVVFTAGSCVPGQAQWLNVLISRWNQIREAGVSLLSVEVTAGGLEAAAVLMAVAQAELVWLLVYRRKKALLMLHVLFWLLLSLLTESFSPLACAFLLAGMFGSCMAGAYMETSFRVRVWMLSVAGILCAGALFLPRQEMAGVRQAREEAARQIHDLRYGAEQLPEGDIREAGTLLEENGNLMTVQSNQEKELYLRGFTGGVLEDGTWKALPDAAYGGTDAGILKWLKEQNFDPLTQQARYYELCDEDDQPEKNGILIQMEQGSRHYFYTTASLLQITLGESREIKDQNLLSRGIRGQRQYKTEELSGSRPAELTIVADWVRNPENEAQRQYSEAEAVYRDFVYRHYTTVDDGLEALMQQWFWDDYETDSDGIYSAVTQIRKKLAEGVFYTDTPDAAPEGEEPVRWFLTESRRGNAVQYASAAVQAFRSHGIPARYVEGYHIAAQDFTDSADGSVQITGANAHAWAEVYFDGVGWMPVDVTPGYYYDALRLQQMVGMPDAVRKTAALEDSEFGANEVNNQNGSGSGGAAEEAENPAAVGKRLLGMLALVLILYTVLFSAAELTRGIRLWRLERRLRDADGSERVGLLESLMFALLRLLGSDATLGWNTMEYDKALSEQFTEIEEGEYSRACQLMEQVVYGDKPLEAFEERTLFCFLDKLAAAGRTRGLGVRLRIRYLIFG